MNVAEKLKQLGWKLPQVAKPIAAYVPTVRVGELVYVSGQLPWRDGKLLAVGKVPSAVAIELAQQAAAQCAVLGLAAVGAEIGGDWDRLVRLVRIGAFVQCDNDFSEQAKVANGASELMQQVLGEQGLHTRAAVGTNSLPLNAAVEIEFLFHVR